MYIHEEFVEQAQQWEEMAEEFLAFEESINEGGVRNALAGLALLGAGAVGAHGQAGPDGAIPQHYQNMRDTSSYTVPYVSPGARVGQVVDQGIAGARGAAGAVRGAASDAYHNVMSRFPVKVRGNTAAHVGPNGEVLGHVAAPATVTPENPDGALIKARPMTVRPENPDGGSVDFRNPIQRGLNHFGLGSNVIKGNPHESYSNPFAGSRRIA